MQLLFIFSSFSLHVSVTIDHPQVFSSESFHTTLIAHITSHTHMPENTQQNINTRSQRKTTKTSARMHNSHYVGEHHQNTLAKQDISNMTP
jgi:hypothetical protein